MNDLRYPIGTHDVLAPVDASQVAEAVADIDRLPGRLREAVQGLDDDQLEQPYRPEGWTVCQLVHHIADSHLNAYTRLRLALTEDVPTIRAYDEKQWAELSDARVLPLEPSLAILDGVHHRWASLLGSLEPQQFGRLLDHPELGRLSVAQLTCLYGWHSRHHVSHITALRDRNRWRPDT